MRRRPSPSCTPWSNGECIWREDTSSYTDHATLRHFPTQPNLSRHQARWTEKMADFDFEIEYLPGKQNVVADAISCHPDLQLNLVFRVVNDFKAHVKDSITKDTNFKDILATLHNLPVSKPIP